MHRPEVPPLTSVVDTSRTSGERIDMEIVKVSIPVIESSMDEDERWIEEVKEKCERAFKGWPRQYEQPDDERDPKVRESSFSKQLYRPRVVTIGPIFHRDKSTDITDEEKYLIVYLMNHLYNLDLEGCLMMMKNQVAGARKCYSDSDIPESFGSTNDNRFAEMLLLDSYFILFMLTSISEIRSKVNHDTVNLFRAGGSSKSLEIMQGLNVMPRFVDILHLKDLIMLDLLILQNQIPFFVIEELFKELHLKKPLQKYAVEFFMTIHPRSTEGCKGRNRPPKFSHLLHLFHWSRVPENKDNVLRSWRPQLDDVSWKCCTPSATELRKSATVFEKKTSAGSSLDITFRRGRLIPIVGVLSIPRLHIHDYSNLIFHNLIAFELQRESSDRRTMAFSALMRNLLQSEEDVKLLRRRGILVSSSMTDRQLIDLFARLSQPTESCQMPMDVYVFCRQVLSYHNRRMSRFYANTILKCFPNW